MNPNERIIIHEQAIEILNRLRQAQHEHSIACMNFAQYERAEIKSLSAAEAYRAKASFEDIKRLDKEYRSLLETLI
jgi:hypothetical protein